MALLCGAIGATAGWFSMPPRFESAGLVSFQDARENILFDSTDNDRPPGFKAFVTSQQIWLESREFLTHALARPELREIGWPEGDAGIAALQHTISTALDRNEPILTVTASSRDAATAKTTVNAVLGAFLEHHADPERESVGARRQALLAREAALTTELGSVQNEILTVSDQYGYEAIQRMHASLVEALVGLDQRIAQFELAQRSDGDTPILAFPETTADRTSRQFEELEKEERTLLAEIRSLSERYGSRHPMVRERENRLGVIRIEMDLFRSPVNETEMRVAGAGDARPVTLEDLRAARTHVSEQVARVGAQRLALAGLTERERDLRDRLSQTRSRLDELALETNRDRGRIQVVAWGEQPLGPSADRRAGLAAAGLLFGGVGGLAVIFIFGLLSPYARYLDELVAIDRSIPVIGVLPDLDQTGRSGEGRAARAVHQLRNLLELQASDPNRNVCAITSCDRGEGKTSLALALATSSATAERRTLVIDADVMHGSLTHELGLTRATGLCEAIGPAHETGQIHPTRQPNLWAMPLGSPNGLDPEDLSRSRLAWMLDALRPRFDTIIIDTGPLLSSVEASLVTALADRTVLLVERRQRRGLVRSTLDRLRQINARVAGFVFNRADVSDFRDRESPIRTVAPGHDIAPLVARHHSEETGPIGRISRSVSAEADPANSRKVAA